MGTNPTNPLLSKIQKFEDAVKTDEGWESKTAEYALNQVGATAPAKREILRGRGNRNLKLEDFRDYVNLEMTLVAEPLSGEIPIHKSTKSVHPNWFRAFTTMPFVRSYYAHYDERSNGRKDYQLGMVFPRKGMRQGLILHNGDLTRFLLPTCCAHVFCGSNSKPMPLVVQPFTNFIQAITK